MPGVCQEHAKSMSGGLAFFKNCQKPFLHFLPVAVKMTDTTGRKRFLLEAFQIARSMPEVCQGLNKLPETRLQKLIRIVL